MLSIQFIPIIWMIFSSFLTRTSSTPQHDLSPRYPSRGKITFPEPVAIDKFNFLFQTTLPLPKQPNFNGKEPRYKPYFYKPKPIFRYNYRKLHDSQRILPYYHPPYVNKPLSLYQITQNVLKQTKINNNNRFNDQIHDPGIKPVVENIKDDIKYDFRTKMHYFER